MRESFRKTPWKALFKRKVFIHDRSQTQKRFAKKDSYRQKLWTRNQAEPAKGYEPQQKTVDRTDRVGAIPCAQNGPKSCFKDP